MKVLLVESNASLIKLLGDEVRDGGFEVLTPNTSDHVLEVFANDKIDLVVLNPDSFDGNGYQICSQIRKSEVNIKGHVPIIFALQKDEVQQRIRSHNVGADDFVEIGNLGTLLYKINSFLRPDILWAGLKTLLVEDEKISAKFISHVIKSKGASVKIFANPLQAFDYLKEGNKIDLVLTDHLMPQLTGIDLVKKIRTELGLVDVPIVFISSIQDKNEILNFFKAGGNDYIAKPLLKEELYVKVGQLLGIRQKSNILQDQVIQLEQLNRLKDQFLAVCSHDLRTPLNTILGLSNLIAEEEKNPETVDYAERIEKSAKDLLEMVNELLDFSEFQMRKDRLEFEKLDLLTILKECVHGLSVINTKAIKINTQFPEGDLVIRGNRGLLLRAFNNILSNAYKFTRVGGDIIIKADIKNDKAMVLITDTGIGMSEDMVKKIFEKLSGIGRKGTEGEKSVGIGMSIVKEIIDKHCATIKVTSRENIGTTFEMLFERSEK